ncbi:MAG: hypothetical protein K0R08_1016 [Solimicrobium sp.]|nr:hypothetical protein [Solimicrobium sp.]
MSVNSTTIQQLEAIAEILPAPVYWIDIHNIILGANEHALKAMGASCLNEIIGKTAYDLYPKELAEYIVKHNMEVMEKGISLSQEETILDLKTEKVRYFTTSKSPLRDDDGRIIGLIGSSIEVTAEKEAEALRIEKLKKINVFKHLDLLAPLYPVPVYWYDLNSVFVGANDYVAAGLGVASIDFVIGVTPYDLYPREIAEHIVKHNDEVIRTGQMLSQEEPIKDRSTGQIRYYDAFKAPLRDENGEIIGVIGTSIEITDKKEKERLTLENKNQKIEHQQKLITLAHTVAHDISSPLSALNMMMHLCDELHENKRSVIKRATESILDIANNLLSTYRNEEQRAASDLEQRQPLLISDLIMQLLSEKKAQYSNHPVRFETEIVKEAQFAFAHMQTSQFRRSMSNLINNAVDALDNKSNGLIAIKLTADTQFVAASIQDNGKGMSPCLVEKMLNRQSFTEGKKHGHGLGLQQVWDTLDYNDGEMTVNSVAGEGTTIQLTFPRIDAATWIAQTIHLKLNSIVVILDDEESIHGAWDTRFAPYLKTYPTLNVHHFKQGQEALNFFSGLTSKDKDRIVFLSDYELLRQDKNGLQIIEESGLKNTTLVTSYYANAKVRDKAILLEVKILPKQMASIVPIEVELTHFL